VMTRGFAWEIVWMLARVTAGVNEWVMLR
jgi:hypothetical protein